MAVTVVDIYKEYYLKIHIHRKEYGRTRIARIFSDTRIVTFIDSVRYDKQLKIK
jgi:hypothetical protein